MSDSTISEALMALAKPDPSDPSFWDRIGVFWTGLEGWMRGVILVGLAVGTLVAFLKWTGPRVASVRSDARAIRDTLVGRPPVRDSITKKVVSPAIPSIGERMASQEASMAQVASAVDKLADATSRLTHLEERMTRVEDALITDRRLEKIESVQLLRTIETAVQSDPGADPTIGGDVRPGDEASP